MTSFKETNQSVTVMIHESNSGLTQVFNTPEDAIHYYFTNCVNFSDNPYILVYSNNSDISRIYLKDRKPGSRVIYQLLKQLNSDANMAFIHNEKDKARRVVFTILNILERD